MKSFVTALFRSRVVAEAATVHLAEDGVPSGSISMLMPETSAGCAFSLSRQSKAPEGAAAGAAIGGVLGALAASVLAVGAIAVPGLGIAAAGPVVAALAGAGAGGTTLGLLGAAIGAAVPEHEARLAAKRRSGVLLGVHVQPGEARRVAELLEIVGAQSVTVS